MFLPQCFQCLPATSHSSWDTGKDILAMLALPFSVLSFFIGTRQKRFEKNSSYYQKVVIDDVLPLILNVFDNESARLTQAGFDAKVGTSSQERAIPRSCRQALFDFSNEIFKLQDHVVQRVAIFDEGTVVTVRQSFQKTQDDLTAWFEDVNLHKGREILEIDQILRADQRDLIRTLYSGEARAFRFQSFLNRASFGRRSH